MPNLEREQCPDPWLLVAIAGRMVIEQFAYRCPVEDRADKRGLAREQFDRHIPQPTTKPPVEGDLETRELTSTSIVPAVTFKLKALSRHRLRCSRSSFHNRCVRLRLTTRPSDLAMACALPQPHRGCPLAISRNRARSPC